MGAWNKFASRAAYATGQPAGYAPNAHKLFQVLAQMKKSGVGFSTNYFVFFFEQDATYDLSPLGVARNYDLQELN